TMAPPSVRMPSDSLSLAMVSAGLPSSVVGVWARTTTASGTQRTQRTQRKNRLLSRLPTCSLCPSCSSCSSCPLCPLCPLCSVIVANALPLSREHPRHLGRLLTGELPAQQ